MSRLVGDVRFCAQPDPIAARISASPRTSERTVIFGVMCLGNLVTRSQRRQPNPEHRRLDCSRFGSRARVINKIKDLNICARGLVMRGVMRTCVRLAALLLVSALVGCSVVDDFSGRAVDFNLQAELVQEQTMLLNVVRASMRRPMQFTGLQSITGTASVSGNGSLSFPFGPPRHRPAKTLSPDVLGLGGSVSGGPSFIVPVLDTQEFYEGILNPISLQVFDYYLEQGFPAEVLFDLFISRVVVTWAKDGAPPGTGTGADANCAKSTSNSQ